MAESMPTCTGCNKVRHWGVVRDGICRDCAIRVTHEEGRARRADFEAAQSKETLVTMLDAAIARTCNVKGA